jgi:hypothetical protein
VDGHRTLRRRLLLVGATASLLLAGCGDPPADRIPGPDLVDEPTFEVVDTIAVDDDGFSPDEVTITAGDGLELVNEGDEPLAFDGGDEFDTGLLLPGERSTLVLTEAGEFPYTDGRPDGHEGLIVVEPDPDADDTNS